ncbi:Small G protein signaling modulator 2 [Labeo rohita]|uniref:Small G protein signaling modulator 2 n=1 Tax=Labeo rohita TaxID=84645 RepID=A0ABQ8M0I5_LABRO|nr:Small G protein signaling modulator 2 [Labeo rohita]
MMDPTNTGSGISFGASQGITVQIRAAFGSRQLSCWVLKGEALSSHLDDSSPFAIGLLSWLFTSRKEAEEYEAEHSSIEACLSHLLKRRAAGFLRSDKIAALFTKIGKVNTTVSEICRKVQEQLQQQAEITRATWPMCHSRADRSGLIATISSTPPPPHSLGYSRCHSNTMVSPSLEQQDACWLLNTSTAAIQGSNSGEPRAQDKSPSGGRAPLPAEHLSHSLRKPSSTYGSVRPSLRNKYYEKEALMHDSVFGPILAALLVGPCALEYTKLKTSDHFWTDPSANELVQRHRIHGAHRGQEVSPGRRPALGIRKRQSSGSMSEDKFAASAREYVESLHQNSRVHLLYGKNNVLVQPKKDMEVLRGYLSLHQTAETLTLKWTPNQLINGTLGDCDLEKRMGSSGLLCTSLLGVTCWLSCPVWRRVYCPGGKVFPKLRKRNSTARLVDQDGDGEEQIAADYVFRIVYPGHRHDSITINYHHTTGSRAPSLDDDEEEEDRLHAMISMICSRNLTDPNVMKGFYHQWPTSFSLPPFILPLLPLSFHPNCYLVPTSSDPAVRPVVDHGDMMEMQGFGGSPLSWQQGECTSHMSSCLSCSTGGSNASVELPASWLAYCRHLSTVRTHLSALVNHNIVPPDKPCEASGGLSKDVWSKYQKDCKNYKELELLRLVYYGGVEHEIRKEVWPFLLGHYKFGMDKKDMAQIDEKITARYQQVMREWKACEVIVKQREKEMQSAIFAKLSSGSSIDSHVLRLIHRDSTISNEVFMSVDEPDGGGHDTSCEGGSTPTLTTVVTPAMLAPDERPLVEFDSPDSGLPSSRNYSVASGHSQIMSSIDDGQSMEEDTTPTGVLEEQGGRDSLSEDKLCSQLDKLTTTTEGTTPSFSSYTIELLDTVALNLHRIDKDVQRCDRNYYYFTTSNLEKLRNIMCSYVWEHLEIGYVQGMCDLLAPLMVILDDECLAYSCFTQLMKRMSQNFPTGGAMDTHFANMRSLIQILDSELFELMHQNGDYTHFYFCYRWFLLDFKRELLYEDVFAVWEVIWVAPRISSKHFVLFIALALVEVYRDIILDNNMDFTDIIKFFNEMAERHDVQHILRIARELVHKVQTLIENK